MRTKWLSLVAVLAACLAPGIAAAQSPSGSPVVSPYLNLLIPDQFGIPGGNPGQYQTLVEPFIQGRQSQQANAAALNRLNSQVNGRGAKAGGGGGASARFMNYSHYYSGLRH